jgi:farnesyl diphosphate synthase
MHPDVAWAVWSGERARRVEDVIDGIMPPATDPPQSLHEAMRYAVLGGGKRTRALLAYAGGELTGAEPAAVDRPAAAVELIHAYSLVHDDLPCMDDDVLRRGKPTCHVAFGEATALLAGDALQSLAFEVLADASIDNSRRAVLQLAQAAGSRGMAGGQQIDLDATGKPLSLPELEFMHIHKTGALIRAAVLIGAGCGKPLAETERASLDRYAKAVGLAFQVVDDVLDSEASTATLGKTAGKDSKQGKPTYVSTLGAPKAKALAEELRADAHAALQKLGSRGARLAALADFVVLRKF